MATPPERLSTARLTLRPFRRRDAEALEEAVRASLPDLHEWLPWAHLGYGREDAANYIRESGRSWKEERAFDFSIRRQDEPGRHLGNISIWFVSRPFRTGEIGYWVRSDETGTGIATEATARMVKLGFEGLGMHRIVLRIAVGNRASERVAEKLEFTREGVLREEINVRGIWLDHSVWSVLEPEYRRRADFFQDWIDGAFIRR